MIKKGLSLHVQLYGLIVALVAAAFMGSVYNNILNMRDYLSIQLASHAQDAAHNLGLSISPYMDEPELVVAQTMASAMFDSGYYHRIGFSDTAGVLKFELVNPESVDEVPNWFRTHFTLSAPIEVSEVSNGWIPAGNLSVQSHLGNAYIALWQHSVTTAWFSSLLFIVALLLTHFILRAILRPLSTIAQQATEVTRKNFVVNNERPVTSELKTVVNAMNNMVENVQRTFNEQTERAAQLSKEVYIDSLTGLPNRKAAMQQFDSMQLERQHSHNPAYALWATMTSLKSLNEQMGYQDGDQYISTASTLFQQFLFHDCWQLYRISGSEFLIFGEASSEQAETLLGSLMAEVQSQVSSRYPDGFAIIAAEPIGMSDDFTAVAKRIDTKITTQQYFNSTSSPASNVSSGKSKLEWQATLSQYAALIKDVDTSSLNLENFEISCKPLDELFDLSLQPVFDSQGNVSYAEAFVRFTLNNEILPTADVFAMAERLGYSITIEKAVVSYILHRISKITSTRIALNIGNGACAEPEFVNWLFTTIDKLQTKLPPLAVEVNENAVVNAVEHAKRFFARAKQSSVMTVIERFGGSINSFRYIRSLDLDAVKIDGSYIKDLDNSETRFFVEALVQICHGIGIKIIASHVESHSCKQQCRQLHIEMLQGNALSSVTAFSRLYEELSCNGNKFSLESMSCNTAFNN